MNNMEEKYIKVKELAEELGMTVSNVNIQIARGHAGDVKKVADGETKDYALTIDNVSTLLDWLRTYGRGNKLLLLDAIEKYEKL